MTQHQDRENENNHSTTGRVLGLALVSCLVVWFAVRIATAIFDSIWPTIMGFVLLLAIALILPIAIARAESITVREVWDRRRRRRQS